MRIVISAGPTREAIDPVRFITNRSTGKMGYAIARAAVKMNLQTVLVSGPVNLTPPEGVAFVPVESAAEMAEAMKNAAAGADIIVMAAAVADYRPKQYSTSKVKKSDGDMRIELERTEDILLSLGKNKKPGQILVGFAAETDDLLQNAQGKLERKNLDWIAANTVSDGFGTDTNTIMLLGRNGEHIQLGPDSKQAVAREMIQILTLQKGK